MSTDAEEATIISEYEAAYARANPGRSIRLKVSSPGWYTINGYKKYRLSHYAGLIARLNERADEAAELALKPRNWIVIAKGMKAVESIDYYLDADGGWVTEHSKAHRYTDKLDAEWVAVRKNTGLPHNYVVAQKETS